ncbi:MAG: hypothetical protein HRT89_03720, partial [Lentisphaeria bacterium]|nr:hypothetical protein [Lentisphaeria bacterium]
MNQISQKENACQLKIESIKEAQIAAIVEANCCTCIDHALILLDQNKCLDKVNSFLCTANLNPRCLDIQIYYMLLKYRGRMSQAAAQRIETLCNAHYNSELPNYINLKIPFDPWNYQYCNCPTENHLFNDVSNRLAECITFPERVFSDGNTAEDYREYWEDAFRQLCQTRVMHGMREWRSTVYFHVVLDDAWMIYHLLPDGSTRNAASVFLDYLHLSLAISLRDDTWCGPHSRVYNNEGFSVFEMDQQIYASWVNELIGQDFRAPALVSDYIVPEPIAGLPLRDDSYVSIEKLGPRYYPAGEGEDAFNPNRSNIYLCQSDREDWPGDGILYNQQTPSYVLGSVQDWGTYQGAWHMHCMPWSLTISGAKGINQIISFTGSEKQSDHQGGIMTWPNHSNDQDATLFQHQGTLFSQMRGRRQEKFWEVLHDGDSEC